MLPGQIASGNAFLFPSEPRLTGSSLMNSGSVPAGNWYPFLRKASPNALSFGYPLWHVAQLVLYFRANAGMAYDRSAASERMTIATRKLSAARIMADSF